MPFLFTELRRRNVFKVGAAYAIVAWLLLQISDVVLPTFEAPLWVAQTITFVLAIGFPLALVLAWAIDLTPKGATPASSPKAGAAPLQPTAFRFGYISQALILLAVGFLVVDQYLLETGTDTDVGVASSEQGDSQIIRSYLNVESVEPIGGTLVNAHLALSPDGRRLVYAAQEEGLAQLFMHQLDQFGAQPIPGTEGAHHPFFSPDGEWIGFYTEEVSSSLKKVSVRGGLPQELGETNFSSGGSWELDDTIIYGTGDSTVGRNIYRIPATGGPREEVLISDTEQGYVRPHVLPGGDAIIFVVRPGRQGIGNARDGGIAVLSLPDNQVTTLIQGGYAPAYAPTGHIVFAREGSLWAMPFDVERLEKIGPEIRVIQGVQQNGFQGHAAYAFSGNGVLAYVPGVDQTIAGGGTRHLVWVDREGNEEPIGGEPGGYSQLSLSPDGNRLAYVLTESTGPMGERDIWVYDLVRHTSSRLTFDAGPEDRPVWTPDGQSVVFRTRQEVDGVARKAADGTGQTERIILGDADWPDAITPDGNQLLLMDTVAGESNLYILSMGEETPQLLLGEPFDEDEAEISPDGRWMAYEGNDNGRGEIYVRPFPNIDGGKWQISTTGGMEPLWGPDGRELFYRDSLGAIVVVDIETDPTFTAGNPRVLIAGRYGWQGLDKPTYQISPDGQRFLLSKEIEATERVLPGLTQLNVVYNWFEELRRLAPPSDGE